MEYLVYILYSHSADKYYTGHTDDLGQRMTDHNSGKGNYTSRGTPWMLKYTESFPTRAEAMKREMEIKNKKSRKYIEFLISSAG